MMNDKDLKTLVYMVKAGALSRRDFLRKAGTLGLSSAAASMLLQQAAAQDATPGASPMASPVGTGEVITSMTREEAEAELEEAFDWEEPQNQGGEVIHSIASDIQTLNSTLSGDVYSSWIIDMVFESLIGISYVDGQPRPTGLADSWEIAEDGVTYTLKLHEGVKWHDGEDFTADDVVFTFDMVLDESSLSTARSLILESLSSYEKIDDHTVKFIAKSPNADFLQQTLDQFEIMPKHIWEGVAPADWPSDPGSTGTDPSRVIGTGPFKFVEWVLGDHVTIERNPDYWNEKNIPVIDRYIYKVVAESSTAVAELQTGQTDVIGVPFSQAKSLRESNPELQIVNYRANSFYFYAVNQDETKDDLFTDVRVRQALHYALDRDLIADIVYDGFAGRADGVQPWLSIGYDPDRLNTIYTFEPEKAKSLLEEAGWTEGADGIREKDGRRLSFECSHSDSGSTHDVQIPYMQQAWRDVGIEMTSSAIPFPTLLDNLNSGSYEMSITGFTWGTTVTQETMFGCEYTSPAGVNWMHYCNPDYDALIAPSHETLDLEKRIDVLIEQNNIVNDDMALGTIVFRQEIDGGSARLHNFFPTAFSRVWWLTRAWVDAS